MAGGGCAPLSSPYPPDLSSRKFKRRNSAGSSRIPSRLARRTRPIRQYQAVTALSGLLPPSPATPGSGCPQPHPAAATTGRRRSSTSIRNNSASWRTRGTSIASSRPRPPPADTTGTSSPITTPQVTASLSDFAVSPMPSPGEWRARPNLYCVLLTYLDESYTSARYFIAGLLVPDTEARSLTAALDNVVEEAGHEHGRIPATAELHAHHIVSGLAAWKKLKPNVPARIAVYGAAIQAIADHDVTIIIRSVDIIGLGKRYPDGHDHPHSVVLTHLVERVDEYAGSVDQNALLIANEVDEQASYRRDLWRYQRDATWGYRSRQITRVVDTLHFAPSSSSRLVQAADLIAFLTRRIAAHTETDPRSKAGKRDNVGADHTQDLARRSGGQNQSKRRTLAVRDRPLIEPRRSLPSTVAGLPSSAMDCPVAAIRMRALPPAGRYGRSTSAVLSNTTRHWCPSASSKRRTAKPEPLPRIAQQSRCLGHRRHRQLAPPRPRRSPMPPVATRPPAWLRVGLQPLVFPTPRIPVTACTTTTPGLSSAASSSGRGWKPGGVCGKSPTQHRPSRKRDLPLSGSVVVKVTSSDKCVAGRVNVLWRAPRPVGWPLQPAPSQDAG